MLVYCLVPAVLSLLVGQRNPFFCSGSLAKEFVLEASMTQASFCFIKGGITCYRFSAVSICFAKKRRLRVLCGPVVGDRITFHFANKHSGEWLK